MIKASIIVSDFYKKNRLFDINNDVINADNRILPFYALKQRLKNYGIELATHDIHSISSSSYIIYNDMPKQLPKKEYKKKSFLILFESNIIRPDNWDFKKHNYFHKIFTWNDSIIDNKKYFKINFGSKINFMEVNNTEKTKLAVLIAGNKTVNKKNELYSERRKAIRWFEKNHPDDFDLYGIDWDKYTFTGPKPIRILNRINGLRKILQKKYSSYRGKIINKNDILRHYKFSICYENVKDIPGYITEKIFDCFFAGTVPIYWGASNIKDYIPEQCFIDKTKYETYEELYDYIKNMTDSEYVGYSEAIQKFINSPQIYPFSVECFAETIIKEVLG